VAEPHQPNSRSVDFQVLGIEQIAKRSRLWPHPKQFQPFAEYTDKKGPVIIPPGLARLCAHPIITGSGPTHETTATFGAALCAACIEVPPLVKHLSTAQ
jgi:hypothetical protein